MSDFISRQKALDELKYEMKYGAEIDHCGLDTAYDIVENIPSVEPKERIAKVIEHDASVTDTDGYKYHRSEYLCGICKKRVLGGDDYCSHCGAKLDWSGNE